ncbi:Protein kinase-like domain [Pseudocohnilembus persalinus]|uniref:Protein kinase-like domain n=1 Tax=Pseudocohnilembus persalinus TaxID=266149 RepID=A0A0V0R0P5_PSEPJ|nr:Protein kinase-like domain [Pseudocohnilembus persalinus]|eukprot:KRX08105.1 Protein kinase-like domain [Pseudocohnilembus persalinus]
MSVDEKYLKQILNSKDNLQIQDPIKNILKTEHTQGENESSFRLLQNQNTKKLQHRNLQQHQQKINKQSTKQRQSNKTPIKVNYNVKQQVKKFQNIQPQQQQIKNNQEDHFLGQNLKIQDFLILNVIGHGAYAQVRLAKSVINNQIYALKIYDKRMIKDDERIKNINKEIQILQMIKHPNIYDYYGKIENRDSINLILEYMGEQDLQNYLESRSPTEFQVKRIFFQIAKGLEYLHRKNIVHRDIKLENIMIQSQNQGENLVQNLTQSQNNLQIKIIDFGFGTQIIANQSYQLRIWCGTPKYMAPELVNRQSYNGPPVDVWAYGVMLSLDVSPIKKTPISLIQDAHILNVDQNPKEQQKIQKSALKIDKSEIQQKNFNFDVNKLFKRYHNDSEIAIENSKKLKENLENYFIENHSNFSKNINNSQNITYLQQQQLTSKIEKAFLTQITPNQYSQSMNSSMTQENLINNNISYNFKSNQQNFRLPKNIDFSTLTKEKNQKSTKSFDFFQNQSSNFQEQKGNEQENENKSYNQIQNINQYKKIFILQDNGYNKQSEKIFEFQFLYKQKFDEEYKQKNWDNKMKKLFENLKSECRYFFDISKTQEINLFLINENPIENLDLIPQNCNILFIYLTKYQKGFMI